MIGWIRNGVFALAVAGLYSVILVLLRTPQLNKYIPDPSIFKSALVIHVNLSVLVWLLSIVCSIWGISKVKTGYHWLFCKLSFIGMLLMALSTIYPESSPIMNNYIPMLENIVFIIGLVLFGTSTLFFAVQVIFFNIVKNSSSSYGERIVFITKITSALMFIGAWGCFFLSYMSLDQLSNIAELDIDYYYEMLFWSGGHLLQFIYTQILMLILLTLTEAWKGGKVNLTNMYEMLFILNFVLSIAIFIGHINYDISDGEFKEFFTQHMIYTGGIVPVIFIALLIFELIQNTSKNVVNFIPVAFISSTILFLFGGLIGAIISGINVTIPAHYHGSTVGISIAFMGFCYLIFFKQQVEKNLSHNIGVIKYIYDSLENINHSSSFSSSSLQIYILTIGQLLHIIGLALAGGYGVLRKTPGEEMLLSVKLYMGMVGIGGIVAIIGGLMFVYICVKNLHQISNNKN